MGQRQIQATHTRSVVKGITWRAIASLTTMALVYIFTGSVTVALELGAIEIVAKIFFYYLHERAWGRISWGITERLRNPPEAPPQAS